MLMFLIDMQMNLNFGLTQSRSDWKKVINISRPTHVSMETGRQAENDDDDEMMIEIKSIEQKYRNQCFFLYHKKINKPNPACQIITARIARVT